MKACLRKCFWGGLALAAFVGCKTENQSESDSLDPSDSVLPEDTGSEDVDDSTTQSTDVVIDAVFFAQTHVLPSDHPYFVLVGNRETLIKAHVVDSSQSNAPPVTAVLALGGETLSLLLRGPAVVPASIATEPGVVQHSYDNCFTGFIPKEWMKPGLTVTVEAGPSRAEFLDLSIGAPTRVVMNMFDVHYFAAAQADYPSGWQEELEAKWPVSELEVRRLREVVFEELVIPPRPDVGAPAARVSSKEDYTAQTGLGFDGEQGAALEWKSALKAAAGTGGRTSLYYVNIYGVSAGGQAGGFGGVGNGSSAGILHHELGHALSLPHWNDDNPDYPYKGDMYGIPAPASYVHVGPTWAFSLFNKAFIPPTVQANAVGGTLGTYKQDPMRGGGQGDQEDGYLMRHFSDYSVFKMRSYLESYVLIWSEDLTSYVSWNADTHDYTTVVSNNGVSYPDKRDVEVLSVMAAISGANRAVNMVYPPIGPYTAGLIRLFDPRIAAQRQEADTSFCPASGCDLSLRITQGGVLKTYMLAASFDTEVDPLSSGSFTTKALNLPAADGAVTGVELLLTPDAELNGLGPNPEVLATWFI